MGTDLSIWCAILGDCHECSTDFDRYGGFIVYIIFTLYSFYILAQICDGHLTNCLEIIVKKLGLSEDVAGATFLAMASSAPELFHSIVATFVLPSPSGVGNIVGSALFNLLCIIGVLPLVSKTGPLKIWWYPTVRDASFYALAIVEIFLVIRDGRIVWWEALIMVLSYGLYVVYFVMNERIIKALKLEVPEEEEEEEEAEEAEAPRVDVPEVYGRTSELPAPDSELAVQVQKPSKLATVKSSSAAQVDDTRCLDVIFSGFGLGSLRPPCLRRPGGSARSAAYVSDSGNLLKSSGVAPTQSSVASLSSPVPGTKAAVVASVPADEKPQAFADSNPKGSLDPETTKSWTSWLAQFKPPVPEPGMWLVDYLMPDPENKVFISFTLCCIWIAIYTYIMVESASRLGCLVGVPEVVMGLTLLAAGTSVPDMIASMAVARDGKADMAAANAVGSNTFDIMLGLGMPWLVSCALGREIPVPTDQLSESIYILAGALAFYLILLVIYRWMLNRVIGFSLIGIYVGSIAFAIARNYTHYNE